VKQVLGTRDKSRGTLPGRQVAMATKLCTVAPDIYKSSVWNLVRLVEVAYRSLENLCSPSWEVDLSLTHSIQTGSWAHPPPHRYGISSPRGVGFKWRGREADHSYPSSAGAKSGWSCTSVPPCAFVTWTGTESASGRACLITSGSIATSRFGCIMCVFCFYAGFV
jgi:hypothetical protein